MKILISILVMLSIAACATSTSTRTVASAEAVNGVESESPEETDLKLRCSGLNAHYAGILHPQFMKIKDDPNIETFITIDPDHGSLLVYERSGRGWKWTKGSQLDQALRSRTKSSVVPQGIFPKDGESLKFHQGYRSPKRYDVVMNNYIKLTDKFGIAETPQVELSLEERRSGMIFVGDGDGDQSMAKTIFDLVKSKPTKTKIIIKDGLHANLSGCPV